MRLYLNRSSPPNPIGPPYPEADAWIPTADAYIADATTLDSRPDSYVPDAYAPDAFVQSDASVDAQPVVTPCDLFSSNVDFPTGLNPLGIVVADFNVDGLPDVAILDFGSRQVSVHLNKTPANATTPTFSTATNISIGRLVTELAAGDINGDGKPDLVIPSGDHSVTMLMNTTAAGSSVVSFATASLGADAATSYVAMIDMRSSCS